MCQDQSGHICYITKRFCDKTISRVEHLMETHSTCIFNSVHENLTAIVYFYVQYHHPQPFILKVNQMETSGRNMLILYYLDFRNICIKICLNGNLATVGFCEKVFLHQHDTFVCVCTVEVRSLHTLRLELLKLIFQPLHKFLVNKQ